MKNGIWVIGDVHGEYEKLLELVSKLPKNAEIVFTGDLVDRGSSSAQVLDLIIKKKWLSTLGNHELMMIDASKGESANIIWLENGGQEALDSYNKSDLQAYQNMYTTHLKWLKQLPCFLHFEIDGYKPLVVSHSYIHDLWYGKDYRYQNPKSKEKIIWRHMDHPKYFASKEKEIENNIYNIFGHTPKKEPAITDTFAMIDTGAVYDKKGYGRLTAIHYPSKEIVNV